MVVIVHLSCYMKMEPLSLTIMICLIAGTSLSGTATGIAVTVWVYRRRWDIAYSYSEDFPRRDNRRITDMIAAAISHHVIRAQLSKTSSITVSYDTGDGNTLDYKYTVPAPSQSIVIDNVRVFTFHDMVEDSRQVGGFTVYYDNIVDYQAFMKKVNGG